ncbi:MAG: lytic transglycosylase domain-containing protein [bacterium]
MSLAVASDSFPFINCFELASRSHSIELDLLLAVASVESNWNADARSSAGAHGVMQIRWPLTAKYLGAGRVAELYNPCLNIDLGAGYLADLSKQFHDDLDMTLAAYNYGPTRLKTRADIPASVAGYVRKVKKRRTEIARQMSTASAGSISEEKLLVMQFNRISRAEGYVKALKNRVPTVVLEIVSAEKGQAAVYLDTTALDVSTRYKLARFIPELRSSLK